MKITRISEHAHQLTRLGFVNCYLVRESDGFTLIDTTLPGAEKDILAAAAAAGAPIRRILLTHAHGDHVGSVDALMTALPDATFTSNARSLSLLRQPPDATLLPGEPQNKIRGSLPGVKSVPSHLVEAGELYGSLRAIATPGHIPGHLAFLDERDGTLYAGDCIFALRGRLTISGYATGLLSIFNNFNWNSQVSLASAKALLDYPIERFACGHGAIFEGGPTELRATIDATRPAAEADAPTPGLRRSRTPRTLALGALIGVCALLAAYVLARRTAA